MRFSVWCFSVSVISVAVAQADERPNVVIILTDDQGTLDAGCYGSTDLHTPNIDRLAASGVRFTRAYAHMVCCPTRAALLTGRHPQRGGINSWAQRTIDEPRGVNMAREEVTIAETLRTAGYRTGLFGKWHLGADREHGPTQQGFDQFFGIRDGFIDNYKHYHLHRKGFHDLYEGTREIWREGEYFPELVVARALDFIDENRQRPFFLYFALNIPHYPEQALKKHVARYKKLVEPRRSYAAIVTTTDDYVGRVIDKLESRGLRNNTIIIFMSDNGHSEEQYKITVDNHKSGYLRGHDYGANGGGGNTGPWIGHKGTFLEGGIRVPAIISYPAMLPQGAVRDQTITAMDWYPTLMDLCGVTPPNIALDGRSLLSVIHFDKAPSPHGVLHFQWQDHWAVCEGDWKLIGRMEGKGRRAQLKMTLHSLADEKPERRDYAAEKPQLVARLRKLHETWAETVSPE